MRGVPEFESQRRAVIGGDVFSQLRRLIARISSNVSVRYPRGYVGSNTERDRLMQRQISTIVAVWTKQLGRTLKSCAAIPTTEVWSD